MGNYFELRIKVNPNIADILSEICFSELDCFGVVTSEQEYKNLQLINDNNEEIKVFLGSADKNKIAQLLQTTKTDLKNRGLTESEIGSFEFTIEEKADEDWSKKWKENWDVTHIGNNLTIVPSWIDYQQKKDEVIIKLDPGSAFGTGTHPTTQLCILAMQKYLQPYSRVADIGTGSGILAIYAKKIGASYAYGCDNDENVISTAKDNALKNNVQCVFEHKTANRIIDKFDFICANILHNVLVDIMGDLKELMTENSILSLSGILIEKRDCVLDAIKNNSMELIDEIRMGDWTSFVVKL